MSSRRRALMIIGTLMALETCLILGQVSHNLLYWKKKLLTDICGPGEINENFFWTTIDEGTLNSLPNWCSYSGKAVLPHHLVPCLFCVSRAVHVHLASAAVAMRLAETAGALRIPCSLSMNSTPGLAQCLAKVHTTSCKDCCVTSWASAHPSPPVTWHRGIGNRCKNCNGTVCNRCRHAARCGNSNWHPRHQHCDLRPKVRDFLTESCRMTLVDVTHQSIDAPWTEEHHRLSFDDHPASVCEESSCINCCSRTTLGTGWGNGRRKNGLIIRSHWKNVGMGGLTARLHWWQLGYWRTRPSLEQRDQQSDCIIYNAMEWQCPVSPAS